MVRLPSRILLDIFMYILLIFLRGSVDLGISRVFSIIFYCEISRGEKAIKE
jgi:hypothetical protein